MDSRLQALAKATLRAVGLLEVPAQQRRRHFSAPTASAAARRSPDSVSLTSIGITLDTHTEALGPPRRSTAAGDDVGVLRQRMAQDGYLFFPEFLDVAEVIAARNEVLCWLAAQGLLDRNQPISAAHAAPHADVLCESEARRFPKLRALMTGERMLTFYSHLIGTAARSYDQIWVRPVSPGNVTGPHLDIVYCGRGTQTLYTSWVPLGDVFLENGPLIILEGSNRKPELWAKYAKMDIDQGRNWRRLRFRHGRFFRGGDYSRNPRAVQRRSGLRWLTTDYRAGDLIVMTAQTMHASLDNVSEAIRLSADTRYQAASEAIDPRWIGLQPVGRLRGE